MSTLTVVLILVVLVAALVAAGLLLRPAGARVVRRAP